jgi:hypothetical protein
MHSPTAAFAVLDPGDQLVFDRMLRPLQVGMHLARGLLDRLS